MLNSQNCFKPNFLKTGVKNENRNVTCDQKLSYYVKYFLIHTPVFFV